MHLNVIQIFCICFHLLYFVGVRSSNEEKQAELSSVNNSAVAQFHGAEIIDLKLNNTQNLRINSTEKNHKIEKVRNRKKRRRKRKRKNLVNQENRIETTTFSTNLSTLNTTKKRRLRKQRRKKKHNQNNILEVTSGNFLLNNTLPINNDSSLVNLIEQLNTNPETNFKYIQINKVTGTFNISKYPKRRNRCSVNNGGCSQICKEKGKSKCSCLKGYILAKNRKKCVDINECKFSKGGCEEICRNTLGSYYCDCSAGFRTADDLKSCQDINECHLRNGHGPCQDTCTNTYGSYICDCSQLNGSRLSSDKHSCEDINECEERTSGCSHLCINTNVGAFCTCPEGMELMSDYKTCQDIDECEDAAIKSSCEEGCVNTIGSYYCEEDIQKDQTLNRTKVPVCPPLEPPQHGFITCARNKSSPYDTFSKSGRRIIKNNPGTKCRLICPTGFRLVGGNRFVCSLSGKWKTKKNGFCTKAPYPKLECPPNQTLQLEDSQDKLAISFPAPQTNVRWKIVESYPKWAKNLKGELAAGHHNIQFAVTDPATKLSSTCSFFIEVKK